MGIYQLSFCFVFLVYCNNLKAVVGMTDVNDTTTLMKIVEALNKIVVAIGSEQHNPMPLYLGDQHDLEAKSATSLIKLNVGGKEYQTTLTTLVRINNTYFTSLFSQPNKMPIDDKGRIFIDRNGDVFSYVLDFLRTNKYHKFEDRRQQLVLIDEAYYFQISDLLGELLYTGGTLLDASQKIKLNEFYGVKEQTWQLLFKATKHGFSSEKFHKLCDKKGPTITVIRSTNGYLFGGYTKESWGDNEHKGTDPDAFIFTLTNPHGIAATKFTTKKNGYKAISSDPKYGPTFGDGYDICLYSDLKTNSYTNFPTSYIDTTGKGSLLFTGAYKFVASDVEVYSLA